MATSRHETYCDILVAEFERWLEDCGSEFICLIEAVSVEDGSVNLSMLLGGEHEFQLICPLDCSEGQFYVEAGSTITPWSSALNEYLLDSPSPLTLSQILTKAVSLHSIVTPKEKRKSCESSDEDEPMEEDDEEDEEVLVSDDENTFTTEWDLKLTRKKKRWMLKEAQLREEIKKAKVGGFIPEFCPLQAPGHEKEQAKQIFSNTAASGILTNDLIGILEAEKEHRIGITVEPVDDNIYQWDVKLFNFNAGSELANDLQEIENKFNYNYIELQMDFAMDLFPFYPPLVKVVRPRLQGSMMQRVTNMEMLKLSYWNPAKEMKSVLLEIKRFLQKWARLEVHSERNDSLMYPSGSYIDIEHHLLRLALYVREENSYQACSIDCTKQDLEEKSFLCLDYEIFPNVKITVSEVNPRANSKYLLEVSKAPEVKLTNQEAKKKEEYWAAGTGYGHSKRPGWDVNAYLAAQKEKDKQMESVLQEILGQLKQLSSTQQSLKNGCTSSAVHTMTQLCVNPVEDMYNVVEGSALLPFIESYLTVDSFLEIGRHTSIYKAIVDIMKELAAQSQFIPLLISSNSRGECLYSLLELLEKKASILLQRIGKATANGSIPKPAKLKGKDSKTASDNSTQTSSCSFLLEKTAEQKLAREFVILFKEVSDAVHKNGGLCNGTSETALTAPGSGNLLHDATIEIPPENQLLAQYKNILGPLQFGHFDIEVLGSRAHHFTAQFNKCINPSPLQVFRIAQELTSLSSSLPLDLSSTIFVRSDEEKINMMKALIIGPEGTPYSNGCFQFDIFFPSGYPKSPPQVNLMTTGNGTVRFNPNLYNCGKVCLSLLGTWEGQQGEQWNETSTILQVLISIQSLILVPEPYFNEPGYEQEINTDSGKKRSADYNEEVCLNSIKFAILGQIHNPSPGFQEVILSHFYLKRNRIIEEMEGWLKNYKSSKLERAIQNLKSELKKLQPPPNLANIDPNKK